MTMSPTDANGRQMDAFKRLVIHPAEPLAEFDPRLQAVAPRLDDFGVLRRNENPTLSGVTLRERSASGPTVPSVKAGEVYFFEPRYEESSLQAYYALQVDLSGLDTNNPALFESLEESEILARFVRVRRCELPLFSWYVTSGTLRQETTVDERPLHTLYPDRGIACPDSEGRPRDPRVRCTAPSGDELPPNGLVHAWVVMRDGRGGTDFHSFSFEVVE